MPTKRTPHPFEAAMLARIAAGWRCERCHAEHGSWDPESGSRVFIVVRDGRAVCRSCAGDVPGAEGSR